MNSFDKARAKYFKNHERKQAYVHHPLPTVALVEEVHEDSEVLADVPETPVKISKFPNASTVAVVVTVRGQAFSMTFDVPGMQGNLPASAFNQSAMTELIQAALTSKLGKVNVCNLP